MIRTVFIVTLICSLSSIVSGQEKTIERIILTKDFFKYDMPEGAKYHAITYYDLVNRCIPLKEVRKELVMSFKVSINLDTARSYMAKKYKNSIRLLEHEQGHVDLGVIYARKFLAALKAAKYNRQNYKIIAHSIFVEYNKQLMEANENYDEETDHGVNVEAQNRWNIFISESIAGISS